MKKIFAAAIVLAAAFAASCHAETTAKVEVNGKTIDTDAVIVEERVLVPLRGVYEELGFNVEWAAENKTADFNNGSRSMRINAAEKSIEVDGKNISSDVPPQIINDRLYLPLRSASEAFGLDVGWDAESKTAVVKGSVDNNNGNAADVNNNFVNEINMLMPKDKNYMFSPISIKFALAMTGMGAENETKSEIYSSLGIDDPAAYCANAANLMERYAAKKDVTLALANSIWLNSDMSDGEEFSETFKKNAEDNFKASVGTVDGSNAVSTVNNWCSDNTNGKITQIIDKPDFLACLVNAVYFKGDWETPFNKERTQKAEFTQRDGGTAETDFMNMTEHFNFYENGDTKILEMPYKDSDISMYFVLNGDKREDVTSYLDKMSYEKVKVSIPKFKTEYFVVLNDILKSIGIQKAFDKDLAQFGGMFENYIPDTVFYIDKVLHKTYIDVDETGTEAAAVTAVIVTKATAVAEPEEIKEFTADKPFSYFIMDKASNEILFMGEYAYVK